MATIYSDQHRPLKELLSMAGETEYYEQRNRQQQIEVVRKKAAQLGPAGHTSSCVNLPIKKFLESRLIIMWEPVSENPVSQALAGSTRANFRFARHWRRSVTGVANTVRRTYFTIASWERTTTHFPLRFANTSIQTYFPLLSFPLEVLFSVSLP